MASTNFDKLVLDSASTVASIATDMSADANDNELKSKVNELITALQTAGVIK